MRPINLLNATKVLFAALALIIGTIDFAAARDLDARTIYRRGHHDRSHYANRNIETRTLHGSDYRRNRHADWRRDNRRHRDWRADHRRGRRYERDRRHEFVREYRGPRGRGDVTVYGGGDGFPSPVAGIGTYAGGLSAWRDPGNGIYFSRDNYGNYGYDVNVDVDLGAYLGGPQILDVDPSAVDDACAYEKGVCIIRRR